MDYRLKLFSWIIVTVVMGASLVYGEAACPDFEESEEGFGLHSKSGAQWEGLLLSHKTSPLKKCVPSLFVEKVDFIFMIKIGGGQYLRSFSPLVSITAVLGHVSINAP